MALSVGVVENINARHSVANCVRGVRWEIKGITREILLARLRVGAPRAARRCAWGRVPRALPERRWVRLGQAKNRWTYIIVTSRRALGSPVTRARRGGVLKSARACFGDGARCSPRSCFLPGEKTRRLSAEARHALDCGWAPPRQFLENIYFLASFLFWPITWCPVSSISVRESLL